MQIDRPIAIAVTLFIIIILILFLVMPEYNAFKALQAELGRKKAEFNAEYDYFSAITKTYYDIQSHKDDIQKIDDALPTDSILGKLVYFFQEKTTENGLIAKSLFLSKSSGSGLGNVNDVIFSLSLMGDYPSLESFIKSLEKSSRLFEVTSISFGSNAPQGNSVGGAQLQLQETYSFSLQIKTHSY